MADDPTAYAVEVVARQIVAEQLDRPWKLSEYSEVPTELFGRVADKVRGWQAGWQPTWGQFAAAMEHLGAPVESGGGQ